MNERRRKFLKAAAAAGALGIFLAGYKDTILELFKPVYRKKEPVLTQLDPGIKTVYSLCLACNTRCGVRVRVQDGRAVKIDGNPYHPNVMRWNPIPYDTPVAKSLTKSGVLCLKGQEAIHWAYDPFRIRTPLKRAGPRGSMKWKPIPWEQLIAEVVQGGQIFKDVGEDRVVEGFRQVRSVDPIKPDAPELGPKANGLVVLRGRGQPGRIEFIKRWSGTAYGTTNSLIAHDAVCANGVQTGQKLVTLDPETGSFVDQMRVDILNSRFVVCFGDVYQSGQPAVVPAGSILPGRLKQKDLKLVVVDPRAGNTVAHADKWIPIKPKTDTALLMAMIRWIIENKRYDKRFLESPTRQAAEAKGESAWTDATFLVIVDPDHPNKKQYLRGRDMGFEEGAYVVIDPGTSKPVAYDKTDKGELFYDGDVVDQSGRTIKVKTALQLLKDEAFQKTMKEWSEITGVPEETIVWLSKEFTSYGRKVGHLMYRAASQQYNGTYMVLASLMVQMLIGNMNMKGGYLPPTSIGWTKGRYDLESFPGSVKTKGPVISREGFRYEDTTEYKNKVKAAQSPYPATLPWFPLTFGGLWTEALNGIRNQYPYPVKILITYFGNPVYSLPAGHKYIEMLKDSEKVPLHIALDSFLGETSMLADYVVPDVSYFEGNLGIMNPYPPNLARWMGVRVPAIEPMTAKTSDGRPIDVETFIIDVAKKLGLPGYGDKGIDGKYPLNRGDDYHIRAIVNLAFNAKVPDASPEDEKFVVENYSERFVKYAKEILPEAEWKKFVYVVVRGGYFEPAESGFVGEQHKYGAKRRFHFWIEKLATNKSSMTGKPFPGTATWWPPQDSMGRVFDEVDKEYPFTVVNYKMASHTQSRTMYEKWALEIYPQNYVEVSVADANALGLRDGDVVKVQSASDELTGPVKVTRRIRSGVIAIAHHYGHWAWGAMDETVQDASEAMMSNERVVGSTVMADPSRGRGIWASKVSRVDDTTKSAVVDPISGSSPTAGTRVKLAKV